MQHEVNRQDAKADAEIAAAPAGAEAAGEPAAPLPVEAAIPARRRHEASDEETESR